MKPEEFSNIIKPEIQNVIFSNIGMQPASFALKYSEIKNFPVRAVAEQIDCLQRAAKKLPGFSGKRLVYHKESLEQASGEAAAKYKATLAKGSRILDMTGGMGIDSVCFSKNFDYVHYCELNKLKADIFRYNINELCISNIIVNNTDSTTYLQQFEKNYFDFLYIDPSRRSEGKRSTDLAFLEPNIITLHDTLLEYSPNIIIKLSPAFDFSEAKRHFPELNSFIVVSVNGECKETLLIVSRDSKELVKQAVVISSAGINKFRGNANIQPVLTYSGVMDYIYLPDCSIIKSELAGVTAETFNLCRFNNYPFIFTSSTTNTNYPGRVYKITGNKLNSKKELKQKLKEQGISRINIIAKGTGKKPEYYYKQFGLKEGGSYYLIITTDSNKKTLLLLGEFVTKPQS